MNFPIVIRCVCAILTVVGVTMLTAVPVGLLMGDPAGVIVPFLLSALITIAAGAFGILWYRNTEPDIGVREGFGIVAFSWLLTALFAALPLVLGLKLSIVDACFESMSGLTTTGATILAQIDDLPKSILYWRSMLHWLGGMGIVVLSLAILPILGIGGMQLYKSEVPGPTSDRLAPRIASTAKILWSIYVLLTVAETIMLRLAPMTWFDAWCHACSTISTGGFSTHSESIKYFHSAYVDSVVTVFMFLGGANFVLHLRALQGKPLFYFRDEEFRYYLGFVTIAVAGCCAVLYTRHYYDDDFWQILRHSCFSVVSIITTTGFCTEDFDRWPGLARVLLLALMFVGGCGGSTSGGIKVSRVLLIGKYIGAQIRLCLYPHSVRNIRLNNIRVHDNVMIKIVGFCATFMLLAGGITIAICAIEPNLDTTSAQYGQRAFETALTGTVATLGNIGPGLAHLGPTANFAWLSDGSKIVYFFSMLSGRLELFTFLVLFLPGFWKY